MYKRLPSKSPGKFALIRENVCKGVKELFITFCVSAVSNSELESVNAQLFNLSAGTLFLAGAAFPCGTRNGMSFCPISPHNIEDTEFPI